MRLSKMELAVLLILFFTGIHFFTQYRLEHEMGSSDEAPISDEIATQGDTPLLLNGTKKPVVVVFGDSFSAGIGADSDHSWPVYLSQMLNLPIINASKAGETTDACGSRLNAVLNQYHPDIVMLQKGGDDLLKGRQHKIIARNLINLVKQIQSAGAKPVLIGFPNLDLLDMMISSDMKIYKEVVKRTGVYYIYNVFGPVLKYDDLKSDDLVHPTAKGYKKIAEKIYTFLQEHPL